MTTDTFQTWWTAYPRKIAKLTARAAYAKALRLTDAETLLSAVAVYIQHKPETQDYCHPATWLNGGRWEDEYTSAAPVALRASVRGILYDCPHDTPCASSWACGTRQLSERVA
jgi:hypothetical protein